MGVILPFALTVFVEFVTANNPMRVYDLYYKAAGTTFSKLNKECSYPCTNISNKMVTFDTGTSKIFQIHLKFTLIDQFF